jgi:tRNA threonylcarbamoyladenosine biosynthesis protein TsaE
MATLTFNSPEDLQAWGRKLAKALKTGDVVALVGDLGAGKTTLVQGIAAGWGYTRRANSPTFSLVNEYYSPRGLLLHMDMYRLTPKELAGFPLEEYLEPHTLSLIEWADRVQSRWPSDTLEVRIQIKNPQTREISFPSVPASWRKRLPK